MALAAVRQRSDERGDLEALRRAAEAARPITLAGERSLPVLDALLPLLPDGLRRGVTAVVEAGPGSTSLALALGAAASQAGSWVGIVGAPSVGLLAAAELGLAPARLLVVADPPAPSWATVVAALLDSVDIVYARSLNVTAADARRLLARAREREALLIPLLGVQGGGRNGHWPLAADVRLSVASPEWRLDGRFVARRVVVTASGKGVYARERTAALWLPDETGAVSPA